MTESPRQEAHGVPVNECLEPLTVDTMNVLVLPERFLLAQVLGLDVFITYKGEHG